MRSVKSVFKIGNGPSSSHTVGPYRAARFIKEQYPDADEYTAILYGSLAFTGAGHGTEYAIKNAIPNAVVKTDISIKESDLPHPNTVLFEVKKGGELIASHRIMSVGGGSIVIEGLENDELDDVYSERNFTDFIQSCALRSMSLPEYVVSVEGKGIREYFAEVWKEMQACVERGLEAEGVLPGGLNISRKAKLLYNKRCYNESSDITMDRQIAAFAYAVCEENADAHIVVTAPTCGSCGVIPSVLYYMSRVKGYPDEEIIDALLAAGVVGNVIRTNASISGAECGCQAEVGSACSMAAAALGTLYHLSLGQIEYAAEVAMEHNLGLTCDPVNGLVQIPCIERNAVAAMRAVNAVNLSRFLYETRRISFDDIVTTMYRTGLDMSEKYRETAHGGLAQIYSERQR